MKRNKFAIINVYSTLNNCILTLRNIHGNVISWSSCGSVGFKKSKRSSSYAAETVGREIGKKAISLGIKYVQLSIRGLGQGRVSTIRGIRGSGIKIARIKDNNRIPYGGSRLKKRRRI